jgi:hypothetical protein
VRFLRGLHLTAQQDQEAVVAAGGDEVLDEADLDAVQGDLSGAQVGRLRRLLASALVSMLNRMHPDDVRAVYDRIKGVREELAAEGTGAGAIDSAPS